MIERNKFTSLTYFCHMKKIIFFILALFSALAKAQQETILFEDFDNGIPSSWTIIDGDGHTVHPSVAEFQPAWIGLEDPFEPGNFIAGSTSYFEPEAKAYRFLITPQLTLGDYGNILSWKSMSHDPSFPDWIMVLVSTTGTEIEDFTDTLFRLNNEFPYWTNRSINLSDSGYVSQNVYLAFVNHTNRGFKLYLDSIQVEINNPVSTPNISHSEIKLYPNPSNGMVYISSSENISNIEVIDIAGKTVFIQSTQLSSIDLSQLNAGMYYIKFRTEKGIETKIFQKI
jgi:hypothetical protein